MSTLTVKNLQGTYPTNQINIPAGHKIVAPAGGLIAPGCIIQIQQTVKTDTFSSSSSSWVDVTGLSVSITPTFMTSKILVTTTICATNQTTTGSTARLLRDSTLINVATSAGSRQAGFTGEFYGYSRSDGFLSFTSLFLDSPATTSSITYKVQVNPNSYNLYVNRSATDSDSSGYSRGVSAITVMEVAQ